jgi:hypothetical protein
VDLPRRRPRTPRLIVPNAIVVAGESDAAAVVEVTDIVHLRIVPGNVEDYAALVRRALSPD